jgi:hypothetical protein
VKTGRLPKTGTGYGYWYFYIRDGYGNTRIIQLRIRVAYRVLPSKYPDIRVGYGYPEFGYPFFLFSAK